MHVSKIISNNLEKKKGKLTKSWFLRDNYKLRLSIKKKKVKSMQRENK